jgi:hypothetical protein
VRSVEFHPEAQVEFISAARYERQRNIVDNHGIERVKVVPVP